MRFDAYAGNVFEKDFLGVTTTLAKALGGVVCKGQAMRRYGDVLRIEVGNHCACWLGFDRGNEVVYFEGKGETSPDLVAAVREHFGGNHNCARGDVCDDVDQEGAFERLQDLVRLHKGPRVKAGYVALPDDPEDGRTWSAGVRGGVGMIRIYEAGKMKERRLHARPN
jgi:hypothetical protein